MHFCFMSPPPLLYIVFYFLFARTSREIYITSIYFCFFTCFCRISLRYIKFCSCTQRNVRLCRTPTVLWGQFSPMLFQHFSGLSFPRRVKSRCFQKSVEKSPQLLMQYRAINGDFFSPWGRCCRCRFSNRSKGGLVRFAAH